MANEEAFTLDGLALNDQTTFAVAEADLTPPSPRYTWASSVDTEGSVLVTDPPHENREITLKVQVVPQSTMDLALAKVASLRDKLAKASRTTGGISLVWTPATATLSCTFDVLAGEVTGIPINWDEGWLALAPTVTVRLLCKPYWRGSETTTSTASSSTPFVTLEVASVPGDIDALGRIIVTDTATQSRRHVEWGLEGPLTYNNATSLLIDSDNMVTTGFGGSQTTTTGAYDPNAAGNNSISAALTPGSTTTVAGTGTLSHVGAFRVKARVQSGSISNLWRFAWRVGDGPMSRTDWVSSTAASNWQELDLGLIQIGTVTAGTQAWTGQIEVEGATSSPGNAVVDYVTLVPTSDGYGKARAAYTYQPGVISAHDEFTGTTAASGLNATVAPVGGTWATSGAATDFVFADFNSGEQVSRATGGATNTRIGLLGTTTYTNVQVEADVLVTTAESQVGVTARATDVNNLLAAFMTVNLTGTGTLYIAQVVAGSTTYSPGAYCTLSLNTWYRVRLVAFASGHAVAQIVTSTGVVVATEEVLSTVLATAGTLASGKAGLWDTGFGSSSTRYYDNVTIGTPASEPIAINSGRSLQFRYDGVIRQDSTGTYYGRPPTYEGSYVGIPVGTSRVLVKARRNDIEAALDDQVTDATQIQVAYTPRGLVVPR